MTTDPDAPARADLARHRAFATGLLLLMAALTVLSLALPRGYWTDLLQAAAKAGVIGGIADWFAITALFRHPLGLPIPHTAIIPNQKARLGAALGRFVANQVFTEADVARTLAKLDLPGLLGRVLDDPATARPAAAAIAGWLPRLVASLEDGRATRLLARLIPRLLGGAGAGRLVARALRTLVAGGRHQEVFGFILDQLRAGMEAREDTLRTSIEDRVREQGGKLVGWAIGGAVAKRVLLALHTEFETMQPDGSELRTAFDAWARHEIDAIEHDPERAAQIGRALRRMITNDTVQAWLADIWARIRTALTRDVVDPHGRALILVQGAMGNLGRLLAEDPAVRVKLEAALNRMVLHTLPAMRLLLAEFIARVVASWDTATITDRLELRIGRDLQFVRINGTVVGFLVGGALYAALRAAFGARGF